MTDEGPPLEALTRRLLECPTGDFLDDDGVDLAALVSDVLCDLGGPPLTEDEAQALLRGPGGWPEDLRRRRDVLRVAAWLIHLPDFQGRAAAARAFLVSGLDALAALVPARRLVEDPDRREELARTLLQGVGMRPRGESDAAAQDRLTTVSSAERARVVRESREAEKRDRELREALARKAAEEAAAVYGRE